MKVYEDDPGIINLYSCGCYAYGHQSALSRCAQHNGYIVVAYNHAVTREVYSKSNFTVIVNKMEDQLKRLKANQFHWIMCYPEHGLLYSYNYLIPAAWRDNRLFLLSELKRLLAPGGYVTAVVDMEVMHTFIYQASLVGFSVKVRTPITYSFDPELLSVKKFTYSAVKANLMLYVDYVDVPEVHKILDCSGIQFDHTLRRAGRNKTCVITSNRQLFVRLKDRLGEIYGCKDADGQEA